MADRPLLELRGINKSFGAVHVLQGVDFSASAGEVTALRLGEREMVGDEKRQDEVERKMVRCVPSCLRVVGLPCELLRRPVSERIRKFVRECIK